MTLVDDPRIIKTVVEVMPEELTVDNTVQRSLDQHRVHALAEKFKPEALGSLTIVKRKDGTRAIIDGQHRHAAAVEVGYGQPLTCVQYENLSPTDEAVMFLALNDTKTVRPVDRFKARVIAQEVDAVAIKSALDQYGWSVKTSVDDWCIPAISAVENVYRSGGDDVEARVRLLEATMKVVTQAWNGAGKSTHATILISLGKFLGWYGPQVDFDKIVNELSGLRPMNLVADIRATRDMQRVNLANAGARILVGLHNYRRKAHRLPEWQNR